MGKRDLRYRTAHTHHNTLQHAEVRCSTSDPLRLKSHSFTHTATRCNVPQRTAMHCNALQHAATRETLWD